MENMRTNSFFKKITVLVFFLITITVSGQTDQSGSLKGKIIDKATKQSLPGASVVIKDSQNGTSTDDKGVFLLSHIKEGVYTLVVSFIGYQEKTINDVQILRNKTNYMEIEVEETAYLVQDVTVQAHRFENKRMSPISSFDFSREEISINPGSQGDIFRAIGMLPGVSSSGGQYSAIAVRGQGTRDNVYMVDDIPVTEVGHLEFGAAGFNDPNGGRFSIFAPRVIDHAEFIGGGFDPQYGRKSASYLGLGLKEGNKEDFIIDGQLDLLGFTINYDGPSYIHKNTSLFLSARYQNFSLLENLVNLKASGLPKYQDFIFKSTTQLGEKNKLSVIAIYSPETFLKDVSHVKEDKELKGLILMDEANSKTILGINLRTLTGKNSYLKNILYYNFLSYNNSIGVPYPKINSEGGLIEENNIPFENNLRKIDYSESKIGYRSIYTIHFKNNSNITAGIDLDRVDVSNNRKLSRMDTAYVFNSSYLTPGSTQYYFNILPVNYNADYNDFAYNASAYLNYSLLFFKRLSVNAGLRYDYSGFSDENSISPRLSGSLQLNETNSINFGTGIFYQDPAYSDIADQPSDKKLKQEKVIHYILGYKKYFTSDLKFTIEAWYKDFDNMVVRPVIGQVVQNNSGEGWASGIDVNLTKRLIKKVHGQIGYSYMQSKRNDNDGYGEYDFSFSQPNQVNLLIGYKPNERWILSSKFRYATGKPTDKYIIHNDVFNNPSNVRYSEEIIGKNLDRFPDYISLDVRADYKFKIKKVGITAFIDIVDILNRLNPTSVCFNYLTGETFYDGISIFPTFGLRFQY